LVANSGFHRESHVQLAVRDRSCILGWFLLPGEKLMDAEAFNAAKALMDVASQAYARAKPRRKAWPDQSA